MLPYRSYSGGKSANSPNIPVKTPVSSLDKIAREITARGNDVEVRTCKEGIKIFEVTKRVVAVFPVEQD